LTVRKGLGHAVGVGTAHWCRRKEEWVKTALSVVKYPTTREIKHGTNEKKGIGGLFGRGEQSPYQKKRRSEKGFYLLITPST